MQTATPATELVIPQGTPIMAERHPAAWKDMVTRAAQLRDVAQKLEAVLHNAPDQDEAITQLVVAQDELMREVGRAIGRYRLLRDVQGSA